MYATNINRNNPKPNPALCSAYGIPITPLPTIELM